MEYHAPEGWRDDCGMGMIDGVRRRLEQSERLAGALGRSVALWIRACHRTTRWRVDGLDRLSQDLARGPVVVILWHESLLMGPALWTRAQGPLTGIRDSSPIARVAGSVQAAFGLHAAAMSRHAPNRAGIRQVLRATAGGTSIAVTGDGPAGPRRELKTAPIDWARAAGIPVYTFGWATARHLRLRSWDRMILPLPFTRGVGRFDRFSDALPRRAPLGDTARTRAALEAALDRTNAQCDAALHHE